MSEVTVLISETFQPRSLWKRRFVVAATIASVANRDYASGSLARPILNGFSVNALIIIICSRKDKETRNWTHENVFYCKLFTMFFWRIDNFWPQNGHWSTTSVL